MVQLWSSSTCPWDSHILSELSQCPSWGDNGEWLKYRPWSMCSPLAEAFPAIRVALVTFPPLWGSSAFPLFCRIFSELLLTRRYTLSTTTYKILFWGHCDPDTIYCCHSSPQTWNRKPKNILAKAKIGAPKRWWAEEAQLCSAVHWSYSQSFLTGLTWAPVPVRNSPQLSAPPWKSRCNMF